MLELEIKLNETPHQLIEGGGYKGCVADQHVVPASCVFEDAARGTSWNANELEAAFNQVMLTAYGGLQFDGHARLLGKWFKLMLTVHGRFESEDDTFDDKRHALVPKLLPLSKLKSFTRKFRVRIRRDVPRIAQI